MKVAFRVDASARMGSGHLMRCLSLAQALVERGARVLFVSRRHPGHLLWQVKTQGYALLELPAPIGAVSDDVDGPYASWRGVTEDADAGETISALRSDGHSAMDWLVVDHYGLGIAWERALVPQARRILVIDDLERSHDCQLLLDQNFGGPGTAERYRDRVPADCLRLLGPHHALLGPDYGQIRLASRRRDGRARTVFVFFGGSDPTDETGKVLVALSEPVLSDLFVEIVLGPNHPARDRIRSLAAARGNAIVHDSIPSLALLMARADLAFGAAGATTWERLCIGVPTLVTCIADNQRPAAAALSEAGLVTWLGDANEISVDDYAAALRLALAHPERLRTQSEAGQRMVDGLGCRRVVEAMIHRMTEGCRAAATAG